MLDVERVWARVSQRPDFRGKSLSQYVFQVISEAWQLTTGAASGETAITFSAGAVILGITANANINGVAGTQTGRPGLDMFDVGLQISVDGQRAIIAGDRVIGSGLFGPYGDLFPAKELVIPLQGSLLYTIGNRTTSTIDVSLAHHCLVPVATS